MAEKHYDEDEYLMISGIQHFVFCRRQWALIHIEQQWEENFRTVDGAIIHRHVHDEEVRETRGNRIITRGMRISSPFLGFSGQCDVVEFVQSEDGVKLDGRDGLWKVIPIEYKRGKPKEDLSDQLQMAAQALCLEYMLGCEIPEGYLYYRETRRRLKVAIDQKLREATEKMADEMHAYFQRRYTPKAKRTKACSACSLKNICLPGIDGNITASSYVASRLREVNDEETS